jgi:hypothetical protein
MRDFRLDAAATYGDGTYAEGLAGVVAEGEIVRNGAVGLIKRTEVPAVGVENHVLPPHQGAEQQQGQQQETRFHKF